MKKMIIILLALGLARTSFAQTLTGKLDSAMKAFYKVQHFNGSVLIAKNGHILLEKGYGYKNFTLQTPNNAETIYMIASITKQFTATVVLKLVEQKSISLSDPISKYFPGFPNGDKITVYHLLTHTSGVADYTQDSVFMKAVTGKSVSAALMLYNKADFQPGTDWKYSNQGYQLLGEIIQEVTGMSYYGAVRKYIFKPLHMNHSGFDFAGLKNPDKATGYWTFPENGQHEEATIIDSAASFSAGSIYSTVGDLYKWNEGLQHNKIVGREIMDQAYTPFKNHYGFGWFIDSLYGRRVLSHSGDTWGFKTNIARVTVGDVCIVLLNNIEDEEMRGQLTNTLLAVLYNQPYNLPFYHQEIKVEEAILKRYTGTYQISPQFTVVILLEDGGLWIQPKNAPKSRLYAEKENSFFSKVVDGQVEFLQDATGKTISLLLIQNGQKIPGKKIN